MVIGSDKLGLTYLRTIHNIDLYICMVCKDNVHMNENYFKCVTLLLTSVH